MMIMKKKKVVMYIDGVKSIYKDILKMAMAEQLTLNEIKQQLTERFKEHKVTFKVE